MLAYQTQARPPLEAGHPERQTITLGWSLEHPLGISPDVISVSIVGRLGWHRKRLSRPHRVLGISLASTARKRLTQARREGPLP